MKNNLQAFNATLTSMEVAEMVEKTHDNLIKSIRRYSKYIDESNASLDAVKNDAVSEEDNLKQLKNEVVKAETIDLQEFWTESQYKDGKGQTRPCYNITKKGCEFIAHKCTGRKGTVFTARYINRFHEMEHEITGKRLGTKEKVPNVANCPAPLAKNWYRKNLWKIKPCAVKMYCSVEEFLDFLFEYLNNFFDTLKATEIYEEQTGNELEKDVDLLDFFPDMGERAQEILNFTYSYKMDK
jgi:phage regulator Rha-like protein